MGNTIGDALLLKAPNSALTTLENTVSTKAPISNPTIEDYLTLKNLAGNNTSTNAQMYANNLSATGFTETTTTLHVTCDKINWRHTAGKQVMISKNNTDNADGNLECGDIKCSDIECSSMKIDDGVAAQWYYSSDDRLKHNEVAIENGLDVVRQLKPEKYDKTREMMDADYNGPVTDSVVESGFIAQDVAQIPELTHLVHNGTPMALNYNGLHAYTVSAIQALDNLVQSQQARIAALEARFS